MPTAVSLLEAFQANFPGLTQLLTMMAYLIGMGALTGVGFLEDWQGQRSQASGSKAVG